MTKALQNFGHWFANLRTNKWVEPNLWWFLLLLAGLAAWQGPSGHWEEVIILIIMGIILLGAHIKERLDRIEQRLNDLDRRSDKSDSDLP